MDTATMAPVVGQAVKVVDETYGEHDGLVTAVHGVGYEYGGQFMPPSVNVVFVSSDPAKRDPYGNQLERLSSVQHWAATKGMPKPGRYWQAL